MEHLESPGYLQSFHKSVLGARPSAARSSFNTVRFFFNFFLLQTTLHRRLESDLRSAVWRSCFAGVFT